jgi:hypothetical protein
MPDGPTFAQFPVRYQLDPEARHHLAQFRIGQPAKFRLALRANSIRLRKSFLDKSRMASQLERTARKMRQCASPSVLRQACFKRFA